MSDLTKLVDAFVIQIEALIREQALASVRALLQGPDAAPRAAKAPKGKPGAAKAQKPAAEPAPSAGGRRSPKDIAGDADRIYLAVRAKPGSTSEALKAATKIASKHFDIPVKILLKAKRIKKTGEKRATKYFPV